MTFTIPARPSDSLSGSAFCATLPQEPSAARDKAILAQLLAGNVPDFMRVPCTLKVDDAELSVLPDYLCVGSDDDFVRVPLYPGTAQAVADAFGATLPTRFLVNLLWKQAAVRLEPQPLTDRREATSGFVQHNKLIETQRAGRQGLIAGHKKDIVLARSLPLRPDALAIYGWHKMTGDPIQPLNSKSHNKFYVDYSHGIRLFSRQVLVDSTPTDFRTLLTDRTLCGAVSDEGACSFVAYPLQ